MARPGRAPWYRAEEEREEVTEGGQEDGRWRGQAEGRGEEQYLVKILLVLGKAPGLPAALSPPKGVPSFPKGKAIY